MGTEYGQFREWDYENSLEWFMLDYPKHKEIREYVSALNKFYLKTSELWELDFSPSGFEWILADESDKNLVAFRRKNIKGESILVILSFSGNDQSVSIPINSNTLVKLFDSGNVGTVKEIADITETENGYSANITIPRFAGIVLKEKKKINKNTKGE